MSDQTEITYLDGEIVWVKLGSCWWPGEVVGSEKLPPDVLQSFRKQPIAVVKFFQETTYEYVRNVNHIYKYDCSRKNEFINKGLYMYRTKHGLMEKFPEDVIRAETAVGGDIEILTRDEFQEQKKESYAGLFGDTPKKTPSSSKKGIGKRGRPAESPRISTPTRKVLKEKSDYKMHILLQHSKDKEVNHLTDSVPAPSTSRIVSEAVEDNKLDKTETVPVMTTPTSSGSGIYACHICPFSTSRLNVLILHNKSHSTTYMPYTPSPIPKKPAVTTPKSTPKTTKPKPPKPRKDKSETPKKPKAPKRLSQGAPDSSESKKPKSDQEIKTSLLADWDDVDDDSNDDSNMNTSRSPEVPVEAESPAEPTPAELPASEILTPAPLTTVEKPESSSDSKYEFCEDEDWPVEKDVGRKIPRIKSSKRKEDTKSLSLDEDEMAKEVAELLTKTTLPELPSIPEPLKVEENFPEPSIVKSPDKKLEQSVDVNKSPEEPSKEVKPTKAIFKTKTFFRSRHSRSQDAIGKYVAEQLNAERIDITDSDINGSEAVSSPEARDSPPSDPVRVARLAPKIQLKKMKAEAAQLWEREMNNKIHAKKTESAIEHINPQNSDIGKELVVCKSSHDVLYPAREIKPINKDSPKKPLYKDIEDHSKPDNKFNYENNKVDPIIVPNTPDKSPKKLTDVGLARNINKSLENDAVKTLDAPETIPENHMTDRHEKNDVQWHQSSLISVKPKEPYEDKPMETVNTYAPKVTEPEDTTVSSSDTPNEPFMNESTASAVDALLSVSRETDRVPKAVTNDLPEDLFEDDKETPLNNDNEHTPHDNDINEDTLPLIEEIQTPQTAPESFNGVTNTESAHDLLTLSENIVENSVESKQEHNKNAIVTETTTEQEPSESDLQIAETLLNLPSTAVKNKLSHEFQENIDMSICTSNEQFVEEVIPASQDIEVETDKIYEPQITADEILLKSKVNPDNKDLNIRFETEQEKSENLNAAQSLVQMSESIEHSLTIPETNLNNNEEIPVSDSKEKNNGIDINRTIEQKVALFSNENNRDIIHDKTSKSETTSSKLLKILEEPKVHKPISVPKSPITKAAPLKQTIIPGKEKILNIDVANAGKPHSPKQIIIRRGHPNKSYLNNLTEVVASPEKIILSRTTVPSQDGSSVQTFTIQTMPDSRSQSETKQNIIIQPKVQKISKPTPTKIQKVKTQTSLISQICETNSKAPTVMEEPIYDINSMPVVLSEDILTPETIEKMPVVMSASSIISNTPKPTPPKIIKKKPVIENEKMTISSVTSKPESKTLVINSNDGSKVTTPNILSKSSKLRGTKHMLVIDKATGKQKIIVTKTEPTIKEVKHFQSVTQSPKPEKLILLPTPSSPRPGRTQKIVIDPQTGKARVLVEKAPETHVPVPDSKPISAKLIPPSSDASTPGNTVMIITNAQGTQSRIVLTPEHERILFPNKQQTNVTQLKSIPQRVITNTTASKTIITSNPPTKVQTRIVPKQKSAIITSKGQLMMSPRVVTTTQSTAPVTEIRPALKRIVSTDNPKKIVHAVQKTAEPLIFLQQKSGTVMQLTAAQFEHLQKTGKIIQKPAAPAHSNKVVIQKSISIPAKESVAPVAKSRVRKAATEISTPAKKVKQLVAKQTISAASAAPRQSPAMSLSSQSALSSGAPPTLAIIPSASNTVSVTTTPGYPDLENFEEMLPSTAIVRHQQVEVSQPPPTPEPASVAEPVPVPVPAAEPSVEEPAPAQIADGQLLAVPGENFGGPPGSFYLCMEDNGTLTPIDNRPLMLENNQLVPMAVEPVQSFLPQPERRDILEAALANSDVFHAEPQPAEAPDFRDLNANVSVHCRVSETSTVLNQPIMTPVEVPSKCDTEPAVTASLEDGLAVIGVTPHAVPTSLELPITVTDPRIAPRTADPLSGASYSPRELALEAGRMSMPLLTEEAGRSMPSMPILTEEGAAADPAHGPADVDDAAAHWSRRLLTPCSDTSETSAEIPLQAALHLSVADVPHS